MVVSLNLLIVLWSLCLFHLLCSFNCYHERMRLFIFGVSNHNSGNSNDDHDHDDNDEMKSINDNNNTIIMKQCEKL